MDIGMGSVVKIEGREDIYVITNMKNYEDYGSCSYNRRYYVVRLDVLQQMDYISEFEGYEIPVKGIKLPFTIVEDIPPFRIIKEVRYKVEQKKVKTVAIYD